MNTIERLKSILDAHYSYMAYRKVIKEEFPELDVYFSSGGVSYAARVWMFINNIKDVPTCPICSSTLKYIDRTVGFRKYCCSKCAANSNEVKSKRTATNLDRFGVECSGSSSLVRQKRYDTMLTRYGVAHALQSPTIKARFMQSLDKVDWDEARAKAQRTTEERYGVRHYNSLDSAKERVKQTNLSRYGVTSPLVIHHEKSTARRRAEFLSRLDKRCAEHKIIPLFVSPGPVGESHAWQCASCDYEFNAHMDDGKLPLCPMCFPGGSKSEKDLVAFIRGLGFDPKLHVRDLIAPREIDIYLPEHRLAIEFHGTYWHSEDKVGDRYHAEKLESCRKNDVRLIQIFEPEWQHQRSIVESRIRMALGQTSVIYARKCEIVALSAKEAGDFFNSNHIQGTCVSRARFGLLHEDNLVAAMSFGASRFSKKAEWELLRFANALGVRVVGAASRLLAHFDRSHGSPSMVSYSDRRWNTGALYLALGFTYSHTSAPNYWYFDKTNRLMHRTHFQKHKLHRLLENYDPALTERENMRNTSFRRIFDCGMDVFLRQ